jgi:thiol-disulfide isomerase/thioredoxin
MKLVMIAGLGLLLVAAPVAAAQGPGTAATKPDSPAAPALTAPPSLESVRWAGPAPSLEALRGKTVVLLIYATWCPKCNAWSGELFKQLKEAIKDRPIVVLAVNADSRPSGIMPYITERNFFAPNILLGYDPTMPKRCGFQSNLYHYLLIGPDGGLVDRGEAGSFYPTPQGQQFVLGKKLSQMKDPGKFTLLDKKMSDPVKQILWPIELGRPANERALAKAREALGPDDQKQLDAAINGFLDRESKAIQNLAAGDLEAKMEAYGKAEALATSFKLTEQGKEARKVLIEMNKDRQFKRELAARNYYEKSERMAAANPSLRARLLLGVARRFKGTQYGERASQELGRGKP